MKSVKLDAYPRTLTGRRGVKKLKAAGRIPAVIYGRDVPTQSLEVDANELEDLIHHSVSENILLDLIVKDDSRPKRLALVQDVQHHPLGGHVLHVDMHEVSEAEKVTVMVPVETAGEAIGVKVGGGVLEHVLFKLKVRALPKDLPEQIVVDVSNLELGKTIHLGEIPVPPGVELLGDKKISVISVAAPKAEVEEVAEVTEGAAPVAADVEMIKEKKDDAAPAAQAKPGDKAAAQAADKKAAPTGDKKAAAPAEKKK